MIGRARRLALWPGRAGLLVVAVCASCEDPPVRSDGEDTLDRCSDGLDNDLDGLVDCEDPRCGVFARCSADGDADSDSDGDSDSDADGDGDCDPVLAALEIPGEAMGVAIRGDFAYVASGDDDGLVVVDLSVAAAPEVRGGADTPGQAWAVALATWGEYIFVADGASGLVVVNVGDAEDPNLVGEPASTQGDALAICVDGERAYVAEGITGIEIFDVSDPETPEPRGILSKGFYAQDVDEAADLAVVAGIANIILADVSSSSQPERITTLGLVDGVKNVVLDGGLAWIANGQGGLKAVSLEDEQAPGVIGELETDGLAMGLARFGDRALVSVEGEGLLVVDVSRPEAPSRRETIEAPSPAWRVAVSETLAVATYGQSGILVIDLGCLR
ncbi:MAG: hypothetical protein HYY06_02105 [Deltaproteobacteria bacterium]|nr:hypothetical protein [Deltaproteobacteria bacterium]